MCIYNKGYRELMVHRIRKMKRNAITYQSKNVNYQSKYFETSEPIL